MILILTHKLCPFEFSAFKLKLVNSCDNSKFRKFSLEVYTETQFLLKFHTSRGNVTPFTVGHYFLEI